MKSSKADSESTALSGLQQVFRTMTFDAQKQFLENELRDILSEGDYEKLTQCLSRPKSKAEGHSPYLGLRRKKAEINVLLVDLKSPSPVSSFHAKRDILEEVIVSLTNWFEEIWQTVYEWKSGFEDAHRCLLYARDVLEKIRQLDLDSTGVSGISCRCTVMSYPLTFNIKNNKGKIIKNFSGKSMNIRNADKILLWLWRELFVSLSVARSKSDSDIPVVKKQIMNMLLDVEEAMGGPNVLERILHGGGSDQIEDEAFNPFEEDEWQDESDDEDDEDLEDDEDEDDLDDDSDTSSYDGDYDPCDCSLHASHWSNRFNHQRLILRDAIHDRLVEIFSVSPSLELYRIVVSISPELPNKSGKDLLETLSKIACASSSTFAAALEIYGSLGEVHKVMGLLETHTHLLRPCDTNAYQIATRALAASSITGLPSAFPTGEPNNDINRKADPNCKQLLALKIVETQLQELTHTIHLGVLSCFHKIQDPTKLHELKEISRLPYNSARRASRVEEWVETIETPPSGGGGMNPMTFAAFVMGMGGLGLPFGGMGGMGEDEDEDADLVTLLDQLDSREGGEDYMYLKEEYSPDWADRFEGWIDIAGVSGLNKIVFQTSGSGSGADAGASGSTTTVIGGQALLQSLYVKMVEDMPWLKAKDIVDELISRLRDRPAKAHILAALEALGRFAKLQRSNITVKTEKKKRNEQKHKQQSGSSSTVNGVPITAFGGHQFTFGTIGATSTSSGFMHAIHTIGGLDDVD
ncbi:hypothetical protein E1B28_004910 [Marasmius oreades]|uniref:Uncharacterized protein n=1 Tax=Marasmius oreades TaxID=181124 RepID=A0A9P8ADK8_9AGAR|nr:uncharacterized protein E1B28_004910 [Marasmius oreades]KAG7097573.1 hypothetical protein E1B28_004910 [Marasmius oreades]